MNATDLQSALRAIHLGDLTAALQATLPQEYCTAAPALAQLLSAAARRQPLEGNPTLLAALRALAGKEIAAGQSLLNFGSGNQFGDIFIGDIITGDRITVSLTLGHQPLPARYQLRAPVADFVGRRDDIDQLVTTLGTAATSGAVAAISVVRGMGGIGKTELAYAVAQQLKGQFPDAQLIVELRGASQPVTPEQALQTIIRAFERDAQLPDDSGQLQGIYRSLLTGRQVLILADDARDAAQVHPLLPPAGCALLVTSRNRFSLPGMMSLDLGALSAEEAERLILQVCTRIGVHAPRLAQLCSYLPLALRISASLLANSTRSVARYLEQLDQERLRLLSEPDDPGSSVEVSLQLSYDTLAQTAQEALHQMSVFPTSFDLEAGAAVIVMEDDVETVLDLLCRRSLVEWDETLERYSQHDLVRVFAAARLADADEVRLRHARHYARVASRAENDLYLQGEALSGLALFDRERAHIDVGWNWALAHATNMASDTLLSDFAVALNQIGQIRYYTRDEYIPKLEAALAATRRMADRHSEGRVLGRLGSASLRIGEPLLAIACYEQWLIIAQDLGDRHSEGTALDGLGGAHYILGEIQRATTYYEQALAISHQFGNRRGEGIALVNLGLIYYEVGDAHQAIDYQERALAISHELGDRSGEAYALNGIGLTYRSLGEVHRAIAYYEQALVISHELGDRRIEGYILGNLGLAYTDLHEVQKAIALYEQWLLIACEISDRRSEGNALGNLGVAYAAMGDVMRSLQLYEQRMEIARDIGDPSGAAEDSWNLGVELEKQGYLTRAVELMQVSVDYEREIGHANAVEHAAYVEALRQQPS